MLRRHSARSIGTGVAALLIRGRRSVRSLTSTNRWSQGRRRGRGTFGGVRWLVDRAALPPAVVSSPSLCARWAGVRSPPSDRGLGYLLILLRNRAFMVQGDSASQVVPNWLYVGDVRRRARGRSSSLTPGWRELDSVRAARLQSLRHRSPASELTASPCLFRRRCLHRLQAGGRTGFVTPVGAVCDSSRRSRTSYSPRYRSGLAM